MDDEPCREIKNRPFRSVRTKRGRQFTRHRDIKLMKLLGAQDDSFLERAVGKELSNTTLLGRSIPVKQIDQNVGIEKDHRS